MDVREIAAETSQPFQQMPHQWQNSENLENATIILIYKKEG